MGKYRAYKYFMLQDGVADKKNDRPRPRRAVRRSNNWKIFIGILLAGVILYLNSTTFIPLFEKSASILGIQKYEYAIIIDAGSTGSRVLAYTFTKSYITNRLHIEGELFQQSKPGLSSFGDAPEKGADTIMKLVDAARNYIPVEAHKNTPLLLRATAGLRLLPREKTEDLLEECARRLSETDFITGPDSVTIMDGSDEGIFSWYTVNLLDETLDNGSPSFPTLDLGGGSMQVTFEPTQKDLETLPKENIRIVSTSKRNITLYTYSFLKLGLQAFRKGVWVREVSKDEKVTGPMNITSTCINPVVKDASFAYANIQYYISGALNAKPESVDIQSCHRNQDAMLRERIDGKAFRLNLPSKGPIAAMSYFFDMVADAGMIHPIDGGEILLSELHKTMKFICETPNEDQPFACFDMMYMDLLLRDLFGLSDETVISLYKKRKGHEVSWALGLAYNTLVKGVIYNITNS